MTPQAELEHLRKLYGTDDVATRAYKAMIKVLNQQINYLNDFEITTKIKEASKDNPTYDRATKMFENMPDMVSKLHKLKSELGIEYVEKEEDVIPISPQTVGKRISNV